MLAKFVGQISVACCLVVSGSAGGPVAAQQKKATPKPGAQSRSRMPLPRGQSRQQPQPELQLERLPPDPAVESADISITANVKARSLLFETVPNPAVEFSGQPARDTVWEATRENLPTPVEPGVTYRDIGIRLKITSVFRDIDRIVGEALGEVPLGDDQPPSTAPTTSNSTKPNSAVPAPQSTSSRPRQRERL